MNHFTFDKGKLDCEVFLYLMTGKSILVSLYVSMKAGVSYSKVSQTIEVMVFYDTVVHFKRGAPG